MALEQYTDITDAPSGTTLAKLVGKVNELVTVVNALVLEVKGPEDDADV